MRVKFRHHRKNNIVVIMTYKCENMYLKMLLGYIFTNVYFIYYLNKYKNLLTIVKYCCKIQ